MKSQEGAPRDKTADNVVEASEDGQIPAGGGLPTRDVPGIDRESLPSLYRDRSFWGMVCTQFLGAFNDNLFKQLLLLLSIYVVTVSLQPDGKLNGYVVDPDGQRVAHVEVVLSREGKPVASTSSDAAGEFSLPASVGRTYHVQASAGDTVVRTCAPSSSLKIAQNRVIVVSGREPRDVQWIAMLLFALPFLLFSGYAGYLSDRFSKRRVVVCSKVAEIAVMLLGMVAFAARDTVGLAGVMIVLFLMGTQSAFFGPGKYGILPEMLRGRDLPRANGLILMTTFLAIIFGQAVAGFLSDWLAGRLWIVSGICVAIAAAGTATSLLIRRVPPARRGLRFEPSAVTVPYDMRNLLRRDRPLVMALLASSTFWLVAGVANSAVNSLGKIQLQLNDFRTSVMLASIGIGIATGAVVAGRISRGKVDFRVVRVGVWGMIACLCLLALPGIGRPHMLGFTGSLPVLILVGMFAGMFAIPVQVFLQARPPEGQKGRMIAVMNQANFTAILLASPVYLIFDRIVVWLQWPRSPMLAFTALMLLPVALFYRPQSEELA